MLDKSLKDQVAAIFSGLESEYIFEVNASKEHESYNELVDMLEDVVSCSSKLTLRISDGDSIAFSLLKNEEPTGITFRGIPNGHEFTSLLLAVLNSDGKGKNQPDEYIKNRIKSLKGDIKLTTYVSLTCTNCPEVVQSLNLMSILNPNISHEMVDGSIYQEEAKSLRIQAVPAVYADGELVHVGRGELGVLLSKLEEKYGTEDSIQDNEPKAYDMIVIGGGPAGVSAAIYSARKGMSVAVIAENVGGQVKETQGIENLISVPTTTGEELTRNLRKHLEEYPISILEHRIVEKVEQDGLDKIVRVKGGETFVTRSLVIATGANWKKLNVPGESDHIGKGVAFCVHCDGPFYKDKHVAVVGGGNSGIEAAIDLAGICSKVTVVEFLDELKADKVLQEKLATLNNVEVVLSAQTTEVIGDGEKVTALKVKSRETGEEKEIEVNGMFIQIGLAPNSYLFKDLVNVTKYGEIEIDSHARTNVPGIYAAGDVTTVPFKQIIVSMGEGAKAALSAFDDKIRGVI
ncbi:MAG TPA: alkyl hydroperoxide reductase subunit F [Bacteroidales bacterium]|nr:alkyl hydroperoxide reductase subunit F [Bacteroidales bacterium]